MPPMTDQPITAGLLRLAVEDNVLVATGPLVPGATAINGGGEMHLREAVTLGHKVAARPIAKGEKILKYGVSIGSATEDIAAGQHVHVHNMQSDYTPTHVLNETATGGRDA
ncbi:UxaA family hydrolase [Paracoccus zhejiangensis]|nr:UxaA family hydrolase [Paracoccus zhejiangensis]